MPFFLIKEKKVYFCSVTFSRGHDGVEQMVAQTLKLINFQKKKKILKNYIAYCICLICRV